LNGVHINSNHQWRCSSVFRGTDEEYIILVGIASSGLHFSYRPAIFEDKEFAGFK
jgi:hypothetical protein